MRPKFVTLAVRSVDVSNVWGCKHAGDVTIVSQYAPLRYLSTVGSTVIEREQKCDFAI